MARLALHKIVVFFAGSGLCSLAVHAGSISPNSVNTTIEIGESITIHKTITLDSNGARNVDVFLLADNTSSMGSTIGKAMSGASAIIAALPNTYQFGVGRYFGDPSEGVPLAMAYQTLTPLTTNTAAVQSGINNWIASGGGDTPEGNFYALRQVATTTTWRPEAQRLVVWFGDAPGHTETTTQAQAISALAGVNAKVIAFNNTTSGNGLDGSYTGQPAGTHQASEIVASVGGSLTNNFLSVSNSAFVSAVTAQISAAASFIDLAFGSSLIGSGLGLTFACTDALGCNHVGIGQARNFDLTITGLATGVYDFDVFAQGVAANEHDIITVTSVPEPGTWVLMLAGMATIGAAARQRSRL